MTTPSLPKAAFLALRPQQWIKNLILFAPLVFSLNIHSREKDLAALAAQGQTDAGMLRAHAALEPGFSVRGFMQAQAFRDPDQRTRYADHLLRAGLPA